MNHNETHILFPIKNFTLSLESQVVVVTFQCGMGLCGIFFNITLLVAIRRLQFNETIINRLLVFQSYIGLLFLAIVLPLNISQILFPTLHPSWEICYSSSILTMAVYLLLYQNISMVTMIRFLYVCFPICISNVHSAIYVAATALMSILITLPGSMVVTPEYQPQIAFCTRNNQLQATHSRNENGFYYSITIPFIHLTNIILNVFIFFGERAKLKKKKLANHDGRYGVIRRQRRLINIVDAKIQAAILLYYMVVTMAPISVWYLPESAFESDLGMVLYYICHVVGGSVTFFPSVVYCLFNRNIRHMLSCRPIALCA